MKARGGLVMLAVLALPLAAAFVGAGGPLRLHLNLGPGDAPFVSGFEPEYEVQNGQASQWSLPRARIALPLAWRGRGTWSLRFAPPLGGPVQVQLEAAGREIESFGCCRHRAFQRHDSSAFAEHAEPVELGVAVHAEDGRRAGLWMDWVRLDVEPGGRVFLAGPARLRPAAAAAALFLLFIAAGFAWPTAAALAAPLALVSAAGLLVDPWLVDRLLGGVPATLAVMAVVAILGRRAAVAYCRRHAAGSSEIWQKDVRIAAVLFAVAYLPRAAAANHPDFYYPDLMIHTRIAGLVARTGLASLLDPAALLASFQEARNSLSGMPYSIVFHLPLAALGLPYDATMNAVRGVGAVLSAVPVVLGFFVARSLGLSGFGVALLVFAPTYPHWLSRAMLPALLGHSFDLLLLWWLATYTSDLSGPRRFLQGALLVAASQTAYSFGIPVTALLLLSVALLSVARERRAESALWILGMGLAGALVSLLLYYRSFVAGALALLRSGPQNLEAQSEGGSIFWQALVGDPSRFFDTLLPLLALIGAVVLVRAGRSGSTRLPSASAAVLVAWAATVFALQALRVAAPGVFRWNHELLLMTPLVCLLAGEALRALAERGRLARAVAVVLVVVIAVQGMLVAWSSFAGQLANAR